MTMDFTKNETPVLLPDERLDFINEDLRLIQKKQGLTFGTDAYLLAAYVRSMPHARAVDLGSGTGVLSLLLLARKKISSVAAVELQPSFAELIERNAQLNGMEQTLRAYCADVRTVTAKEVGGEVSLVVSNPPYMKVSSGKRNDADEKYLARHEVAGTVADFCHTAGRLLRYGGRFVCVWRPDRMRELFTALSDAGLEPKRMTFVHADASHAPSVLLLEAAKGAAPGLKVSKPLLLYTPAVGGTTSRTLTEEAQKIYDSCSFSD